MGLFDIIDTAKGLLPKVWPILTGADESTRDKSRDRVDTAMCALRLRRFLFENGEGDRIEPGWFVTWKPGLRNKERPYYGEPAIAIALLEGELDMESEPTTIYYRERLDLVVGILEDGQMVNFRVDKQRLCRATARDYQNPDPGTQNEFDA